MKLSNAFSLFIDLRFAIQLAFFPTVRAVLQKPVLLFRPHELSRVFMAHIWVGFGNGTDANAKPTKTMLITPNAYGVVLDIGAGHGHTALYLNHARVSRYIALEPNVLMHKHIRAQANASGFHESDGTLIILSCGAEDTKNILSALSTTTSTSQTPVRPIDTIVSVLTLCTIPDAQKTISKLVRDVLKPGGQLLTYEHILSPRSDVAWWQRFWAPLWAFALDGCRMDRPSDVWLRELGVDLGDGSKESAWREWKTWNKEGEDEENLFWHSVGRFVKR